MKNTFLTLPSPAALVITYHFMKASISTLLLCLMSSSVTIAQNIVIRDSYSKGSSKQKVLFVIDTVTTFGNKEFIFNPSKIDSISLIKPDSSIMLYGQKGKFGAVVIRPKGIIKFIRLDAILDKFDIKKEDRGLKVGVNGFLIDEPSNILADENEIVKVEITTKKNRRYHDNRKIKGKFINIITREGQNKGL